MRYGNSIYGFQQVARLTGEADDRSSLHKNNVARLGTNKPGFTYKTASLLQDAHKTLQKRSRRDTTILPFASDLENLRERHASTSSCQQFSNQFVESEKPTRARPTQHASAQNQRTNNATLESILLCQRRAHEKKRKRKNSAPRCRRGGQERNTELWRHLHTRERTGSVHENIRPQNQYLRHGQGNQVWDHCRVAECDYEDGFPCLDTSKRLPKAR